MSEQKITAAKGQISYKDTGGNEMTLGFTMPSEVLSQILIGIMNWEEDWLASTKTHRAYLKEEEKAKEIKLESK